MHACKRNTKLQAIAQVELDLIFSALTKQEDIGTPFDLNETCILIKERVPLVTHPSTIAFGQLVI